MYKVVNYILFWFNKAKEAEKFYYKRSSGQSYFAKFSSQKKNLYLVKHFQFSLKKPRNIFIVTVFLSKVAVLTFLGLGLLN